MANFSRAVFTLASLVAVIAASCNSIPTQPAPDSAAAQAGAPAPTIAGRWSGSFTAQDLTSGGTARVSIAPDATVSGSLVDTVWQRAHGVARTGIITGSVAGGVAQMEIAWSTGQSEKFEGTASAPSSGSLGVNLRQYGPDGNFAKGGNIALALHEQGVQAGPPYGAQPATQPNFMAQYTGRWSVNFFGADGNSGTGSVTISKTGDVTGALVDDTWSDTVDGRKARHASLSGKIGEDGALAVAISWASPGSVPTGSGDALQGKGYFEEPETVVFQLGTDPESLKLNGPLFTMTLTRD